MSDFEHQNNGLELTLSQDALATLRDRVAKVLVARGAIAEYTGMHSTVEGQTVRDFSYPLDADFVGATFFPEGSDIIPKEGTVSCITPFDLEPGAADGKYSFGVDVTAEGIVANEAINTKDQLEIAIHLAIRERQHDGVFEGYRTTTYSRDDKRISPNDLHIENPDEMSIDDGIALLEDLGALEHELTIDDAEILDKVADYVSTRPKIDD